MRQKFTQKERDNETGLDYFLARYYSSTQGRFTSPDEFKGGPEELFESEKSLVNDPTFYADPADPQSLNKYQYAYNNPLRFVDPDGHQGTELIKTLVRGAADTQIGVDKAGVNILIGAHNIGAQATGGPLIKPLEPSGAVQQIFQHAMEVLMLVSPIAGEAGPANVVVAESRQTTVVAGEAANAEAVAGESRVATQTPKEGVYEFPDNANPGKTYVGQSGDMPRRFGTHSRTGRMTPGSVSTTEVAGGKLAREVVQQGRINQLGGTRNNPGSRTSNIRNPVSRQRQRKLNEQ